MQLHGFADASQKAYGAVIYVRMDYGAGDVQTHLLTSKSRVAPTKTLSIPRIELAAAELLGRLMRHIVEVCEFDRPKCFCWTDSTVMQ